MKVEYLNALVQAALNTCATMLGIEVRHGQLTLKKDGVNADADITAVLGMSGKLRGSIVLAFETGAAIEAPPTILGSTVVVGSTDGYVYALSSQSGELRWRYAAGDKVVGGATPAVYRRRLGG